LSKMIDALEEMKEHRRVIIENQRSKGEDGAEACPSPLNPPTVTGPNDDSGPARSLSSRRTDHSTGSARSSMASSPWPRASAVDVFADTKRIIGQIEESSAQGVADERSNDAAKGRTPSSIS
jgi:hypothetical protein